MKKIILFLLTICWVGVSFGGEFIVIVSKDCPVTSVSTTDLKRLYTGKIENISGVSGTNLSLDNPAATSFLSEIVGMVTADYKSFWLAQQIRGGSSAPTVKKSVSDMISYVKDNANALGYVPKDAVLDGVKAVEIK
jgi:ABC-type phosphate transport system substrate-binding protein